jgi:hypothetical protein
MAFFEAGPSIPNRSNDWEELADAWHDIELSGVQLPLKGIIVRALGEHEAPGTGGADGHLAVCTPGEHQNSWDLWMFIPLKMVLRGIDPYPSGRFKCGLKLQNS